jgi:hypothetical protein
MHGNNARTPVPRPWWRRYRVVLYLVLGLAAVDMVVAGFADVWLAYEPHPYRDHIRACRQQAWDLVVVGGSPTAYGFDPAVLSGLRWQGYSLNRVFNLGLVLATTAEVYEAAKDALPAPPRLLLYGITASDLNDDRVEPNGPRQLMALADVGCWCRERPDTMCWCLGHYLDEHVQRLWKLYYYRNGIQRWTMDHAERLWTGHPAEDLLAPPVRINVDSDERLDYLRAAGKVKDFFPFLDHYHLGAYLKYLHRLLDWGEQQGVQVVLIDMPVPADLDTRLCPEQFATYRAALAAVARTRKVPVLWATRDAVGLTDAHFVDLIHLNGNGKKCLSSWVRQALSEGWPTRTEPLVTQLPAPASGFPASALRQERRRAFGMD